MQPRKKMMSLLLSFCFVLALIAPVAMIEATVSNAAETDDGVYIPGLWTEVNWDTYESQKQTVYECGNKLIVSYNENTGIYTYVFPKDSYTPDYDNNNGYVNTFAHYVVHVKDGAVTNVTEVENGIAFAFYNEQSGLTPFASTFDYRGDIALLQSLPHSNIDYDLENESSSVPSSASMGIDVEMEATIVNISVPLNINLVINVNEEDALVYGDVFITNNSKAPVKVKLQSIASANLPFTSLIRPDELPAELDWELLDFENSQKYFSLGLKPETEGDTWKSITTGDYVWAEESFTPAELGVIDGESEGKLAFDAYFGRVQTDRKDFAFTAMFVAELE